jgi:hypothetical protein
VGLFHGNRTGHLLVHCNSRIVIIDFHVLQSKMYSFFIDDELCEIKLERKDDRFYYDFNINKEVDTPKNRERRATEKMHLRKALALLGILALFVTIVFFGLRYRNNQFATRHHNHLMAGAQTGEAIAKISLPDEAAPEKVDYNFVADGRIYRGTTDLNQSAPAIEMPLRNGDEFVVRYALSRPEVHEIDLLNPSERQTARYRQRARDQHRQLHPELSAERIDCVLDVLYQATGLSAYADIYFQNRSPSQNAHHNHQTYEALITDPGVAAQLSRQCR